jgi:CheY-like chemotaxis protein
VRGQAYIGRAQRAQLAQSLSAALSGLDELPLVLIVDDVADNRDIYADFLRFAGYDVIEATNGFEAVEIASKKLPDVILMDLSLPGMDGWDATRKIKAAAGTKHIKIIAVTGHAVRAKRDATVSSPNLVYPRRSKPR